MRKLESAAYLTSAAINVLSIGAHVNYVIKEVNPSLEHVPESDRVKGKIAARGSYTLMKVLLATMALLNYQWYRTGLGPRSREEKAIMYLYAIVSSWVGLQYYKNKVYEGVPATIVAPFLPIAASITQQGV